MNSPNPTCRSVMPPEPHYRVLRGQAAGPFVLICDHASNRVPAGLANLGLPPSELARHIGWDIGAAGVATHLSALLDAPAIFSAVSRLVIDCNRQPDAAALIPMISDGTVIPGNQAVDEAERAARIAAWFTPYHDAIEALLEARAAAGLESVLVSVHSMTDCMAGVARPWQISMSSHVERRWVEPVLATLRAPGDVVVGDNEPYAIDLGLDFSTPFHAMRRGLAHLQVEFRQDEVATDAGQRAWAERFAASVLTAFGAR